ncbi:MAG: hypothetical protein ACREQK_18690 [Candidatus Binatia bacterium]
MRLVTRPDFDGIVCGSLITAVEDIDDYLFVEPKFMQDRAVEIRKGDIIANLPYNPSCTLWFDHHITNSGEWLAHAGITEDRGSKMEDRASSPPPSAILHPPSSTSSSILAPQSSIVFGRGGFRLAPSAARVVYEYYTSAAWIESSRSNPDAMKALDLFRSPRFQFLLHETDRVDAGQLTPEDALNPRDYVLISMTIDGKYEADEPYWRRLIGMLRDLPLEEVMADSEVKRRCHDILDAQEKLKAILLKRATLQGNVIYVDLRGVKDVPDGNRFLLYTLFPAGNISMKIAEDPQRKNTTAISVGYNIFNPTSKVNVGALLERHGGGGHKVVGSCRVPTAEADRHVQEIFEAIKE